MNPAATQSTSVTAVVISYDSAAFLTACLDALLASRGVRLDVVVADMASRDGSAELVRARYPAVRLAASDVNLGYSGGANLGASQAGAESELLVFLNPDVTVRPDTLAALAAELLRDRSIGVVGAKLLYPDGQTIQHAGGTLSYPLALASHVGYREVDRGQHDRAGDAEFVTGALLAVRREAFAALGGFDEGFYPAYFEDSDLCRRAAVSGWRVRYQPAAVAVHHESAATGQHSPRYFHWYHRGRLRFVLKHYTAEQLDQAFASAERDRIGELTAYFELAGLRRALADNQAVLQGDLSSLAHPSAAAPLPGGAPAGGAPPGESRPRATARAEALQALARVVDERLDRQARILPPGQASSEAIQALDWQATVVERAFASRAPAVGPAIVRLRRFWNWMSTKWYVRPLLQQQNDFNALVVQELRELEAVVSDLGWNPERGSPASPARAGAESAATPEARRASGDRLGARLAAIELRLRRLEELVAARK